jgi:preprotein translocase subunit SecD
MLEFPRWKMLMVVVVTAFFAMTALPNVLSPELRDKLASVLPNGPVPLGLDLRGGSHLLLELDFATYKREHMANMRDALREALREKKIGYTELRASGTEVSLRIRPETVPADVKLKELFAKIDPDLTYEENDGLTRFFYDDKALRALQLRLLEQSIEIVNRRVNETGTKEPIVQRQGTDRIVVQVPGLADPAQLKALLGKTAKMTFHLVNEDVSNEAIMRNIVPGDTVIMPADDVDDPSRNQGYPTHYAIRSKVELGGELLTNAAATFSENRPVVEFQFNTLGAQKFGEITSQNIGKRFAVVLDNEVITAPVIRTSILGGRGVIEGGFTTETANQLAMLLRAGALPAPLNVVEERSVGPSLGQDSIKAGVMAAILGVSLVAALMVLAYGFFGLIANIGLIVHLVMVVGALSLMQATLTLPGIAGIVLTMGMGVDANVLIFERIRDEIRYGKSPIAAIDAGFKLAFGTIFDSNITTLIAAALLFTLGAGAVKGFAVTLSIGILSSMFASILVCRALIIIWARRTKPKRVPI